MRYTRLVCGAIYIFYIGLLAADNEQLQYSSLTIADGLVNNTILSIHKDRRGFMWFGTAKGISRYDGQRFYNYEKKPGSRTSLQGNNIFDIEEDKDGTLWFATGINLVALKLMDIETGDFLNFDLPGLFDIECSKSDSLLWLGTLKGLYVLDKNTGETSKHHFSPPYANINSFEIRSLLEDSQGRLWIGTNYDGLFVTSRNKKEIVRHFADVFPNSDQQNYYGIQSLHQDNSDKIWATSNGGGLVRITKEASGSYKINRFNSSLNNPHYIKNDFLVGGIIEDEHGDMWCATDGDGVLQLSADSSIKYHRPGDAGLCNNRIMSLFLDHDILWIGSRSHGIIKAVRNVPRFFITDPVNYLDSNYAFEALNVWTVDQSLKADHFWLGLDGALSLAKYEDDHVVVLETFFFDSLKENHYKNLQIRKVIEYAPGRLYLFSLGAGVIDINWESKKFKSLALRNHQNKQIVTPYLYCALTDDDTIWTGGNKSGLIGFQDKNTVYQEYLFDERESRRFITTLKKSLLLDDIFYVGTWDKGLVLFNKYRRKFREYGHSQIRNTTCFAENLSDSVVWIGTYGSGLFRAGLQGASKPFPDLSFKHYDTEDGLPSNHILGMLLDDYGCLWVTTDKGITRFNVQEGCFENYSFIGHMPVQAFNLGAQLKYNNTLFFGSGNGLVHFNQVKPNPVKPPPVVLTSFSKFGVEQAVSGLSELAELSLSWRDDFFALRFSALDYYEPAKNQYAYKLENFDDNWVYSGNKNEAVYTNLDPGEYIFRVKAANAMGVWNDEGIRLSLIISAPFWKTKFFYFAISIFLIAVFYGWHRLKIKQAEAIEARLKTDLSKNLHDDTSGYLNAIRRLASGNNLLSHDSPNGEKIEEKIDAVSFAIRDTIFGLDASKNSLTDVATYLACYCQKLFDEKEIAFRLKGLDESYENYDLAHTEKTNLIRLFKEGINNISKHGKDCRNVTLQMTVKRGFFFIRLTDDGVGFEEKQAVGLGLDNMQKRAAALGGRLVIYSQPKSGTTVQFRMKLKKLRLLGALRAYGKRN